MMLFALRSNIVWLDYMCANQELFIHGAVSSQFYCLCFLIISIIRRI